MAFPTSPTNGQQVTVNGITYTYASSTQSWARVQGVAGNITATGNISANNYTITGTGIFWGNGSPAVYGTSFWVQDQDFGFTANTADFGNVLGSVAELADTSYDAGSVRTNEAVDGNVNIVNYTITGDKFSNSIAINTTGNISSGNIAATGNISATYFLGNIAFASGINVSAPGVTSLTAGSGITVSAATGAVTVSQDIYTGSDATNTSFPIGSYVMTDGSTVGIQMNQSKTLYRRSDSYGVSATTGSALSGTWRLRGVVNVYCGSNSSQGLFQRTA